MAVKGSGAILSVGSAISGSAIAATAATSASPVVVTATQSFSAGDIVVADAFVGAEHDAFHRRQGASVAGHHGRM